MPVIKSSAPVLDASGNPAVGRIVRAYRADTGALIGSTVTSDGATGDAQWTNVAVLLKMEGVNGGTTFTDSGPGAKTVTPTSVTTQDAQAKFGERSAYFNGGGYLSIPSSADTTLGLGDFAVEAWILPVNMHLGNVFSQRDRAANGVTFRVYQNKLQAFYGAGVGLMGQADTFDPADWLYVKLSRESGLARLQVNDTVVASADWSAADMGAPWSPSLVGSYNANFEFFQGYIDEFRLTKGHHRSGAAPTGEFPTTGESPPLGHYLINTSYTGEVYVVCLDDAAGTVYNHQILRTTPV